MLLGRNSSHEVSSWVSTGSLSRVHRCWEQPLAVLLASRRCTRKRILIWFALTINRQQQPLLEINYNSGVREPLRKLPLLWAAVLYRCVCCSAGGIPRIPGPPLPAVKGLLLPLLPSLLLVPLPLMFPILAPVMMKSGSTSRCCLRSCKSPYPRLCWVTTGFWGCEGWWEEEFCWADMRSVCSTFSDAAFRTCEISVRRFNLS